MSDFGSALSFLLEKRPSLLIPIVLLLLAVYLGKGLYALHGSRSQRRREFLELWQVDALKRDHLWIEMAVWHAFGRQIPADVIRTIVKKPDCARNIAAITIAWKYLKYERGTIQWAKKRFNSKWKRSIGHAILLISYAISGLAAAGFLLFLIQDQTEPVMWIYATALVSISALCLDFSVDLSIASRVGPDILGLD